VTAGILAGGASSRMGRNKALLEVGGRPILRRQLDLLRPLFERVLIGANDPDLYAPFGAEIIPDQLAERSPLAGLHALLSAARTEHLFVVPCDAPFLNPRLIEHLLDLRAGFDAVVPESDAGLEPLHAVYSRSCLPAIEECARRGEWKMTAFHPRVRVRTPRIADREWVVEGRSPFLNVNTPQDYGSAGP